MNKRRFLKLSAAFVSAPLVQSAKTGGQREIARNWAGNVQYSTDLIDHPKSLNDVRELVRRHSRLKALGTRHCFNRIADSRDRLAAMPGLNSIIALDTQAARVMVAGGITYGQLCPELHAKGFALHNLASLPHISVAGACATATHGSGVANGNLATAVTAMELVTADGSVVNFSESANRDTLHGAVVNVGALGIVTTVTLALQPTFLARQYVYEHLPMSQLTQHFDRIMSAGYSVSLFTDWQRDTVNEVWVKERLDGDTRESADKEFFGARRATKNLHPIAELSAENCTEQMGIPGPWYERLPHFRMGFTPSSGKELQAEYFVPSRNAVDAILAIAGMRARIGPHLFISEIRAVDADNLWMSPCYRQPSIAIHFTWKQDWPAVSRLLPAIEKELSPFKAKPHWGKLFTMTPSALAPLYERLPDFRSLIAAYDPQGKFRNEFVARNILGA